MRYQLAAIDIDDTLLGPDHAVSEANARAVRRLVESGVHVVLASGRAHHNMIRFHRQLGLPEGPVVSAQGALVRHSGTGAVWHAATMYAEDVRRVTLEGRRSGVFAQHHYAIDDVWGEGSNSWTVFDQSLNSRPVRDVADLLAGEVPEVAKAMWIGEPEHVARAHADLHEAWSDRLAVTITHPAYLEFARADATKATALAAVAERLGVPRQRVLAFGDGNNDAPMLAWAGLGVAMPHGRPAAHQAARLIAPPGDPETALARAVALVLDEAAAA